jgi:predicted Zn-dependent protease
MTTQTSRPRPRSGCAPARLLLGLALAACLPWMPLSAQSSGNLPALGEATVDELSLPAERRLGRSIFHQIRRAGVVLDDPELEDYLQAQSWRLLQTAVAQGLLLPGASLAPEAFRLFALQDRSINAFALPGGYIGVHTGLVVQSQTESELMSVLAHEIGHVTQRHISRMIGQQRQSTGVMMAAAILAALAASSSPDAAAGVLSLGQTVAVREQLAFSRDAEREADRVGLSLLEGAGFDPEGMRALFERLAKAYRFAETDAPGWMRTHPLTAERITDVASRLQLRPAQGLVADAVEFGWLQMRLRVRQDSSVDALRALEVGWRASLSGPAVSAVARARLLYGLGWIALARRQFEEGLALVPQLLESIRALPDAEQASLLPMAARLEQALQMGLGNWAVALRLGDQLAASHPRSITARALVRNAGQAALEAGDLADALVRAQRYTSAFPDDLEGWRLLGRAAEAQGRPVIASLAAAEAYALLGAWAAAVDQLERGRKQKDSDFLLLSRIDARLATFRTELMNEKPPSSSR